MSSTLWPFKVSTDPLYLGHKRSDPSLGHVDMEGVLRLRRSLRFRPCPQLWPFKVSRSFIPRTWAIRSFCGTRGYGWLSLPSVGRIEKGLLLVMSPFVVSFSLRPFYYLFIFFSRIETTSVYAIHLLFPFDLSTCLICLFHCIFISFHHSSCTHPILCFCSLSYYSLFLFSLLPSFLSMSSLFIIPIFHSLLSVSVIPLSLSLFFSCSLLLSSLIHLHYVLTL